MALGHIDLDKIKANKKQQSGDLKEKLEHEKQINISKAISKLYKDKEPIDNSKNTIR
jgi:hypothetical protein